MRNAYSSKETRRDTIGHSFSEWVTGFLHTRHSGAPGTLGRYLRIWKTISMFLDERQIDCPERLRREDVYAYVEWRKNLPHLNGKKPLNVNTIILETKVLSFIMNEAVNRRWIDINPAWRLGIKRLPSRIKDELSDEQIEIIEQEIERVRAKANTDAEKEIADYLAISFEIARHQGIRMKETCIDLDEDVDWTNWQLRIKSKTGIYETVLNPALIPLFKRLKNEGRKFTVNLPEHYGAEWYRVFNRLRKKHRGFARVSFHSTRVTVASRLERAGMPEHLAMRILNHSSSTVHRVYRRVKPHELAPFWGAVSGGAVADKRPTVKSPDAPPSILKRRSRVPGGRNEA